MPPGRLPVMLFTVPVTEPRPVVPLLLPESLLPLLLLEPLVPESLVPLLLESLVPGNRLLPEPTLPAVAPWVAPATELTWGSEPVRLAVPGTTPVAELRSGMEPETELRPGRELLVLRSLAGPLTPAIGELSWVELSWVEAAEPHGAPASPAAAEASGPAMGMPGRSQRIPVAVDPPRACAIPFSDAGVSARDTDCASAGAARPTVRMAAEAAPPSKIRQLYTKHSISILVMESAAICEFTRPGRTDLEPGNLVKLTTGLMAAHPARLGASGPCEIRGCAPNGDTYNLIAQIVRRSRRPAAPGRA